MSLFRRSLLMCQNKSWQELFDGVKTVSTSAVMQGNNKYGEGYIDFSEYDIDPSAPTKISCKIDYSTEEVTLPYTITINNIRYTISLNGKRIRFYAVATSTSGSAVNKRLEVYNVRQYK